jgi:hypothetical protein
MPDSPCDLPEGTRVILAIQDGARVTPPVEKSEEERRRRMRALAEHMRVTPFSADAPHFTRDEMHERR